MKDILIVLLIITAIGFLLIKISKSETVFLLGAVLFIVSLVLEYTVIDAGFKIEKYINNPVYVSDLDLVSKEFKHITTDLDSDYPFSDIYDLVHFKFKDDMSDFDKFISHFYISSNMLEYTLEYNTDILEIKGSDIVMVSDVVTHYTPRGGRYYKDDWYIRYNGIFYDIDDKLDISEDTAYYIKYAIDDVDTIDDLSGEYTCYNSFSLFYLGET